MIFKGTVGGTGHGPHRVRDLSASIMDTLMSLRPASRAPRPCEPTRSARSGNTTPSSGSGAGSTRSLEPCSIGPADADEREPATLILWAPDYDGGNKAWVRFEDGADAIVGGSQVKRRDPAGNGPAKT